MKEPLKKISLLVSICLLYSCKIFKSNDFVHCNNELKYCITFNESPKYIVKSHIKKMSKDSFGLIESEKMLKILFEIDIEECKINNAVIDKRIYSNKEILQSQLLNIEIDCNVGSTQDKDIIEFTYYINF